MKTSQPSKISRTIRLIPISVLAASLFVITPVYGLVNAASPTAGHSRDFTFSKAESGVRGKVLSVEGTTVKIEGKNSVQYIVDAGAAEVKKSGSAIKLNDIQPGDIVAVRGTVSDSKITATTIVESPRRAKKKSGSIAHNLAKGALSFGTITSVSDKGFVMESRHATGTVSYTVTFDSSTAFKKNGVSDSTSSLVAGARVMVKGKKDSSAVLSGGTIAATEVVFVTGNKTK